jgi:2-polyprenyl-3-methyl-5-hydroxy-6-metoxy-1,4-benzoquinol methylase
VTHQGPTGSDRTRRFYDQQGWAERDGKAVDLHMFGVREDGPIRIRLNRIHMRRVRTALQRAGAGLNLLECGCGGSPCRGLFDLCSRYSGIDFSTSGIQMARQGLKDMAIPCDLRKADACDLPFDDGMFDAVYSAHMIYHIPSPNAQVAALQQMVRVVRPGGVVVLITANPFPLLFPVRLLRRLVAATPVIGALAKRLRPEPPLPYRPMPLGWIRRRLGAHGSVELTSHGLPSTAFNHKVTEFRGPGRVLWRLLQWLDLTFPRGSAYLGNYVQATLVKSGAAGPATASITVRDGTVQ